MRDTFENDGGIRDLNGEQPFQNLSRLDRIDILKVAGWRDEAKTSVGMRDLKSLFWTLESESLLS